MSFTIEPKNRLFQVICSFPDHEIKPAPAFIFSSQVDLTQVEQLRAKAKAELGYKFSYTTLVIKAVATALKEHPYANRRVFNWPGLSFFGPRLQSFHAADISVAAECDIPNQESVAFFDIIRNADQLTLPEIYSWLKELANGDIAANKQWCNFSNISTSLPYFISSRILRMPYWFPSMWEKYRGAAVMVNSPAKYGIDNISATWIYPLVVTFGYAEERPVVVDGKIVVRPMFNLIMSFDRRIMAGAKAAVFFNRVASILENALIELPIAN